MTGPAGSFVAGPQTPVSTGLPTGTLTFLFTDIEGSTRLLQQLGDRYSVALDDHHRLLASAIESAGGVRVGTEGDSVFAVFPSALAAIEAAVAAQRALSVWTWPGDMEVRVRMGAHTGEGRLGAEGYVGIDVHRAARIAAAANGGQVVISDSTRALVDQALPEDIELRDLGEHRLKDLEHPERLYQLDIAGLPSDFPALRSLSARPNNLPAQLTTFVGRARQVQEVRDHLDRSRLVTMTGPGGTGKTRLALKVATDSLLAFADGAFLVPLAPISDPDLVPSAIAQALRIKEIGDRPIVETVKAVLEPKEILLFLDNFEQIVEAAPIVSELLAAAPGVKVIVTSREVLHLSGEQEYAVPPLDIPDPEHLPPLAALSQFEAVSLFVLRARSVLPSFEVTNQNAPAVAEITWRLDGLPLAIELAAARVKVYPPEALLRRLEHTLTLGGGRRDVPARQQTLRDAIAWSYDLLEPEEQKLFRRLGIFVGGWTLEAAEEVAGQRLEIDVAQGVISLVDKSLVRQGRALGDEPWFWMLQTIREFAGQALDEAGERPTLAERHAHFYVDLAEQAEPHLTTVGDWLDRLDREHDNVRAAIAWSIETGRAEEGLRIGGALWRFWHLHGHLAEGRDNLARLLSLHGASDRTLHRGKALSALGSIIYWQNDFAAAKAAYEESLTIREQHGDEAGVADAIYNLAFIAAIEADYARSRDLYGRSGRIFARLGARSMAAWSTMGLGLVDQLEGNLEDARRQIEGTVPVFRGLGDRFGLFNALLMMGRVLNEQGDAAAAGPWLREALEIVVGAGDASGLEGLIPDLEVVLLAEGRAEQAVRLAGAREMLRERAGGGAPLPLVKVPDIRGDAIRVLGQEAFDRAFSEGRRLAVEQALELAREVAGLAPREAPGPSSAPGG